MRRLAYSLLFLFATPALADEPLSEGIASGSLQPFVEFTAKQSAPGEETMHLRGLRLGVSRGFQRAVSLAFYKGDETRYDATTRFSMKYGGVVFGGAAEGDDLLEAHARMLVGSGSVEVKTPWGSHTSGSLLVIEPEIGFGINVTRWAQLGVGVSYRYLSGLQVMGLSGEDLRGAASNIHLMLHF